MSKNLTVGNETFKYPSQGENPGWGESASDWAEAVTDKLGTVSGTYDIAKTTFTILDNQASAVDITGFSFSSTVTRSFVADYIVYRATGFESGQIFGVYNGSAWDYTVSHNGDAGISFQVSTGGQVQYFTDAVYGAGEILFKASTLDVI